MNNGLEPKEELQAEEFGIGKGKNKKFLMLGSLVLIVVLAVLATVFWDQILTSAISPFRVKVTPAKVIQGQTIVVTWPTFNKDKFPLERISFCTVANKPVCKIMLKSTVNDGQQKVITNYDAGTYRVLLQALDANGNYVSGVKITSNSFRIENKPGESSSGGGGSNNNSNNNSNDNESNDSDNDGGDPFTPTINTPTPSASPVPVAVSDYKGTYTVAVANQSGRVTDGGSVKISEVSVSSGGVSWVTTGVKKDTTLTSIDGKTVDNTNCPVTTSIANIDNKFVYVCDPNSLSGTTFAKPGKHTFTVTATNRVGNRTVYKGAYEINTSVQGSQTTNNGTGIGFVTISLATSSTQVNPVINWNLQDAVGVTSTSLTLDGTSMGTVSNFNVNNNDKIRGPYKVTPARSKFDGNFFGIVNTAGLSIGSHAFTISAVHAGTEVSSEASVYSGSYTVGVASLTGKQTTNAGIKISDLKVSADGVSCVTTGVKKSLILTIDDKVVTGTPSCPVSTPDSSVANKYTNFCSYSSLSGSNFSKIGSHDFVITAIGTTGKKSYYKGTYKVEVSAQKGTQINNNGTAIGSVDVSLATTASQKTPVIKWNLQDAVGVKKVSYSLDGNVMGSISASENKPHKNISGPNAARQARSKFDANFTGLVVDSGMTIGSHAFTISAEHSATVVTLPTPMPITPDSLGNATPTPEPPMPYVDESNIGQKIANIAWAEMGRSLSQVGNGSLRPAVPGSSVSAWCSEFMSWVYKEVGNPMSGGMVKRDWMLTSWMEIVAWFKAEHTYINRGAAGWATATLKPGDYLHFDNHSAMVFSVDGDSIVTVEGNYKGKVGSRRISNWRNSSILGVGILKDKK